MQRACFVLPVFLCLLSRVLLLGRKFLGGEKIQYVFLCCQETVPDLKCSFVLVVMNQERGESTINVWCSTGNKSYLLARVAGNGLQPDPGVKYNLTAFTQRIAEDLGHGKGKCSIHRIFI